ncbi:MAG: hypothetical protein ABSH47_16130 [Bryobacteraceae bacterium]|jgi:hypothetical protein
MHGIGDILRSARTRRTVQLLLALVAIALCWVDVSWALGPGLFPIFDELSTRTVFLTQSYGQLIHFFPDTFYADRPLGWAFIRLLADLFGFNYTRQVACLLAIHFANCGLAFLLFRRLGAGIPISIAAVALFGSLSTTAQTATYLGESFDVICLFFLLASALAILSAWRGAAFLSAVLFLAALRSKEFAIITPFLLTVLVALRLPRMPLRHALVSLVRRLWMHYLILLVFGLRYLSLLSHYRAKLAPDSAYFMDLHVTTVLKSLSYYTALVFGADESRWQLPPVPLALGLGAILCWAVLRRRAGVAFGVCAYVLTVLPVCLMPNTRAPYWVYAPQLFLILVLCLLAEEGVASLGKREHLRWVAGVCIALACLSWCVAFQRSPYFRNRVNWNLGIRRACLRTTRDVNAQLPRMGPGTHVYVNHGRDTMPWLFVAGPCSYFRIVNQQFSITCVVDQPTDQLRALFASDRGAKYFVEYHDDGSITVTGSARPAAAPNR